MQLTANLITSILMSKIVIACFFGWFIAQSIKFVTELIKHKRFDIDKMFALGGMPSSHTATIVALLFATFFDQGVTPLVIAIFIIALIVIRDSVGVRQEVGKHARILNKIMKKHKVIEEELEELIGHTHLEVIAGALIGGAVAVVVYLI